MPHAQTSQTDWAGLFSDSTPVDSAWHFDLAVNSRLRVYLSGRPFKVPLSLDLEKTDDGSYLLSEELLGSYGVGATLKEAEEDFLSMIFDLYSELEKDEERLSDALTRQLQILRYFLVPLS